MIDQVTGALQFDRKQLDMWLRTLEFRQNLFRSLDIPYGHFIIPNKELIFSEFLPDSVGVESHGVRPIRQLETAIAARGLSGLHYLEDLMRAHKNEAHLYRQLDTHWSFTGAFLAYQSIVSTLFPGRPELVLSDSQVVRTIQEVDGDLGEKLTPPRREETTVIDVAERKSEKVYDNAVTNLGHIQIWERACSFRPRIVLFHDSFANWFIPFLAESASRLVCVHTQQIDLDLLRAEKPHAVVAETTERFIIQPPNDISGENIHELLEGKGAEPAPWADLSEWVRHQSE